MASNEVPSSRFSSSVRTSVEDVRKKYEIKNLLGEGATSKVYLGEHRQTGNLVAIKCISAEYVERHSRDLKTEINALQKLKHPNIIPLIEVFDNPIEVFDNPTQVCLVMELATGGELRDRIVERVQFTEKDASSVIYQILDAVANIHDAGIVHRDLKLENILYETPDNDSKIMLTDFGLSGIDVVGKTLTKKIGSSFYMAPEIVKKKAYGKEVDVWAIGVITFILLSGYQPFYAEHNRDVFKQIKKAKLDFASPYWNDISDAAKCFVRKLLEKDPKKRYTCRQAMKDPWICGGAAGTKNIQESVSTNMKKNFARNKWKQAFNATIAASRMRKGLNVSGAASSLEQISYSDKKTA